MADWLPKYDSMQDEKWAAAFGYSYKAKDGLFYKSQQESTDFCFFGVLREIYSDSLNKYMFAENPLLKMIPKCKD